MQKVNLSEKLAQIEDYWSPKAVGAVNDFHVKLVKLKGEFVWHAHDIEDELFLVVAGTLRMQFRDREVLVAPGEFIIVPHGTEHRPVADGQACRGGIPRRDLHHPCREGGRQEHHGVGGVGRA